MGEIKGKEKKEKKKSAEQYLRNLYLNSQAIWKLLSVVLEVPENYI